MATYEYKPNNLFAGTFPVATETGTAAEYIQKYTPITEEMKAVTKETAENVIGIAAEDAASGDTFVFYCTGEFFAESINLPQTPTAVTIDDIKSYLRKLNIYLR